MANKILVVILMCITTLQSFAKNVRCEQALAEPKYVKLVSRPPISYVGQPRYAFTLVKQMPDNRQVHSLSLYYDFKINDKTLVLLVDSWFRDIEQSQPGQLLEEGKEIIKDILRDSKKGSGKKVKQIEVKLSDRGTKKQINKNLKRGMSFEQAVALTELFQIFKDLGFSTEISREQRKDYQDGQVVTLVFNINKK
jgi:hypothetical protein